MKRFLRGFASAAALLLMCRLPSPQALADDYTWTGTTTGDWDDSTRWLNESNLQETILGIDDGTIPDDNSDNVFVQALPDVVMSANRTIGDLTLSPAGDVYTGDGVSNFSLVVQGITELSGSGSSVSSTLNVRNSASTNDFDTDFLTINSHGILNLIGGAKAQVDLPFDLNDGGTLRGAGVLEMNGVDLFENDGTINAVGGTLSINRSGGSTSTFDFDGANVNGALLQASLNSALIINMPLSADTDFNGTIQVDQGGQFQMADDFDLAGITFDPGIINLNGSAGTATISGSNTIGMTTSFAELNVNSGTGTIFPDLDVDAGVVAIASGATLELEGTASFASGSQLQFNSSTSHLVINGTTTIKGGTFNWDGPGSADTTIGPSGALTIDVTMVDTGDNVVGSTINNSGTLDVSVGTSPDEWTLSGTMNLTGGAVSSADGDSLLVNGTINATSLFNEIGVPIEFMNSGDLNVTGASTELELDASTRFENGSNISVSNGTLELNGLTTWESPNTVSGSGTIHQFGNSIVTGNTTINTAVYDWDGFGSATTTIGSSGHLTINAEIESSGAQFDGDLVINGGAVTVNTSTPWIATGDIAFGNLAAGPNELNGQDLTIQGAGSAFTTVFGTATINADVSFDSNVDLRILNGGSGFAFNGDVGFNGTTVNENAAGFVEFSGGALEISGNTTLNVSTFDWDGASGSSNATTTINPGASLTINANAIESDPTPDGYDDTVLVDAGTLTVNTSSPWTMEGFLNLDTASGIPVVGGSEIVVRDGQFVGSGQVNVTGGGTAQFNVPVTFEPGSSITVNSTLELNGHTEYQGATGSGTGTLLHNTTAIVEAPTNLTIGGFHIGAAGSVTMNGGAVTTSDFLREVGGGFTFDGGTLTIDGGTATFNSSLSYAGPNQINQPTLIVQNGANAAPTFSWRVGNSAGEFGTTVVDGVSGGLRSTLRGTGGGAGADLYVGDAGTGVLDVLDGGLVDFGDDFILGNAAGSSGTATVDGVSGADRAQVKITRSGSGARLIVGANGQGDLNITNGGLVEVGESAFLGSGATGDGELLIGGSAGGFDATLDLGLDLNVGGGTAGPSGVGLATINAGGLADVNNLVRVHSTGQLFINGGTATSNALQVLGGTLDVNGGTATVTTALDVDNGTLLVRGGGQTTSASARTLGASALTDVDGGTLDVTGDFDIDGGTLQVAGAGIANIGNDLDLNDGSLLISGGGQVTSALANIGGASSPIAQVNGASTLWQVTALGPALNIGVGGLGAAGTLEISGGASVDVTSFTNVATSLGTTGVLTVSGAGSSLAVGGNLNAGSSLFGGTGALTFEQDATVDVAGTLNVNGGNSLNFTGGTLSATTMTLNSSAIVNWTGGTLHVDTVNGNLVNGGGTLAPGNSPGTTVINGDYTQNAGTLAIEIAGFVPGTDFDQVMISGAATLAGTLDVNLLNPALPLPGDEFQIMTFASRSGEFDTVNGAGLLTPLPTFLLPLYSPTDVKLRGFIPGDGNLDDTVGPADYTLWADGFGIGDEFTQGDYNGDGMVGPADYTFWADNFGMSVSAPAGSPSAVPEPSAGMLIAVGITLLFGLPRRGACHRRP